MKKKLVLLGFGNAGKAFTRLLLEKLDIIREEYASDVVVTAVSTRSRGSLVSGEGLDIADVLRKSEQTGRLSDDKNLSELSALEIAKQADYDVLIEMTPLDIFTGQPAISHIEAAFERGKDVITANKGPVAWKFADLKEKAAQKGCRFFYETTVMDGTPVFNLAEKTLKLARVTEVSGILNSTTNFILEEMAKGAEYDDIMARGRSRGFIEADPAMDIEGYDAAAKITALLNVLMDAHMTPDMVERKGIEDITIEDIRKAEERGNVIKLLCSGQRDEDGRVRARVGPEEIPRGHLLASIDSTTSAVSITTDLMKKITIVEHEPEIEQTAYGIFGDLLRILGE